MFWMEPVVEITLVLLPRYLSQTPAMLMPRLLYAPPLFPVTNIYFSPDAEASFFEHAHMSMSTAMSTAIILTDFFIRRRLF